MHKHVAPSPEYLLLIKPFTHAEFLAKTLLPTTSPGIPGRNDEAHHEEESVTMKRFISVGVMVMVGCLLLLPSPAKATLVTIDEIIFQGGGGVNPAAFSATANLTLSDSTLTIVLTNTSAAAGGAAGQNLLSDIGFTLPTGVTIANTAATNAVALTGAPSGPTGTGSIAIGAGFGDTTWGAANAGSNGVQSENNITVGGDVNTVVGTISNQVGGGFDLAGNAIPPGNVDGPDFGILSNALPSSTCNSGLQCEQNSLTFTLALAGTVPANLIALIDAGYVVVSFGSPNASVIPEPSSLLLAGTALLGLGYSLRNRIRRRNKELVAA
jgi:hypothetical protein